MKNTHRLTTAASPETAGSQWGRIYLCEVKGAVRRERGHFAGVFGDVAVKARRWIEKVLHVFVDAFHLPLEPDRTHRDHLCERTRGRERAADERNTAGGNMSLCC